MRNGEIGVSYLHHTLSLAPGIGRPRRSTTRKALLSSALISLCAAESVTKASTVSSKPEPKLGNAHIQRSHSASTTRPVSRRGRLIYRRENNGLFVHLYSVRDSARER